MPEDEDVEMRSGVKRAGGFDGSDMPHKMEKRQAEEGGGLTPPGGDSASEASFVIGNDIQTSPSWTITDSFLMKSWGYSLATFARPADTSGKQISTPAVCPPYDMLYWYISHAEFDAIPQNTIITHVKCTAELIGTQVSFLTNASDTQAAAPIHLQFGIQSKGDMGSKGYSRVSYQASADAAMIPTSVGAGTSMLNDRWGLSDKAGMCDGIAVHCNNYLLQNNPYSQGTYSSAHNRRRILRDFTVMPIDDIKGKEHVFCDHDVNTFIKQVLPGMNGGLTRKQQKVFGVSPVEPMVRSAVVNRADGWVKYNNKALQMAWQNPADQCDYENAVVNLPFMGTIDGASMNSRVKLPLSGIGLMAVHANIPTSEKQDYLNASAIWRIRTSISFRTWTDSDYTTDWCTSPSVGLMWPNKIKRDQGNNTYGRYTESDASAQPAATTEPASSTSSRSASSTPTTTPKPTHFGPAAAHMS